MSEKSLKYWKAREEAALTAYQRKELEYTTALRQIYADEIYAIEREINEFYARYARAEGITLAEAKARIANADLSYYEKKAAEYVKNKDFSDRANAEMRLYNAMMKINRLEMLKARIGMELTSGSDALDKDIQMWLGERAEEEAERQAGILGKSAILEPEEVGAIINASFHNATFSDRIWANQEVLHDELSKLLVQGIIQGRNPRQLAAELRKSVEASRANAERLLRTELARVQTDVQLKLFEKNGFDEYQFIANHADGKTCSECKGLDGKIFKVKGGLIGENLPPIHPNCRCSTAAYMDSKEYDEWLEGYKDHGLSFEDWKIQRAEERAFASRNMSNGLRTSPLHILDDAEVAEVRAAMKRLGIPEEAVSFNTGSQTGLNDRLGVINIRGDILPDLTSTNPRDTLSIEAVLAHEYYGHYKNHPSNFRVGDWRDEFRASYDAAINAPGLTREDRAALMRDAYNRAAEAGVSVRLNKNARRILYGYDD